MQALLSVIYFAASLNQEPPAPSTSQTSEETSAVSLPTTSDGPSASSFSRPSIPSSRPSSRPAMPSSHPGDCLTTMAGSGSCACPEYDTSEPGPSSAYPDLGTENMTFQDSLESLSDVLPDVPSIQLKYMLEICDNDPDSVYNYLKGGLSLPCMVKLLRSCYIDEDNVKKIILEEYGEPSLLAEEAIAFYKSTKFSPHAELRISIQNQPPVDVGGVRKQFVSDVFSFFTKSTSMQLFEGPGNRLRPIFKQTSISSGLLKLVGKMVGHNIVLDGQGFPFFSPACYFYMAGHTDRAVSVASLADAGERVQRVVSQVSINKMSVTC